MKTYNWDKDRVAKAVKNSYCYSDVLRELNIPIRGNNSNTLKRKIKEYSLDISHFTFTSKNKGKSQVKPASNYLKKGIKVKSFDLKRKLLREGLKENKCEICGIDSWLDKPINCQIHHIDGDPTNNELSNLQMLCPNCHSQTDNYCGSANKQEKHYCIDCGKELKDNKSVRCRSCATKYSAEINRKKKGIIYPSKEELEELIKTTSFTQIGKMYGVSDNSIRKLCKKYELPYTKTSLGLIDLTPIPMKTCKNCGVQFKPKSRDQMFCDINCANEYQAKNHGFKGSNMILETVLTKEKLLELHKSMSWDKIAKQYNTTRFIIGTIRKKYGI